jgi:NAD(P)-dependent dehydrogenase (short-subunit alcohol dehydrogenase family)
VASNQTDMQGRVAVVTGGGSGLGRATSTVLAGAGAHLLVTDIDEAAAQAVAEQIRTGGGRADAHRLDVTDSQAVEAFFDDRFEQFGAALDCLVNNAGTDMGADVPEVTDKQWHAVFEVNAHAHLYTSRAFVNGVLSAGSRDRPADIVSVISISALTVGSGAAAYNASKAAALKLAEVMQSESRERGWPVRVSAINPSAMNTPMMDQWHLQPEQMMDPVHVAGVIRMACTLPPDMVLQSVVVTSRVEAYPR